VIRNATLRISNLRQVGLQQADLSQIDDLSAVLVLPLGIANYSYFFRRSSSGSVIRETQGATGIDSRCVDWESYFEQ